MTAEPFFFHIDLDAFFASVEQLDNPKLKGRPVIVGGMNRRGVVSTCSYEARKFGVHSAMPIMAAKKLCPHGVFIQCRMVRYHEKSKDIMALLKQFSPDFHQFSIDEAFLNMTGMEKLMGNPETSAKKIKAKIYSDTGLTVSIGAASNKYIAKIASGLSKPDGLVIIKSGSEKAFMQTLELKNIWGIGGKTRAKLEAAGLGTIANILRTSKETLQTLLGNAAGSFLYDAVRGLLVNVFNEEAKAHSVSTEKTFQNDLSDENQINDMLFQMAAEIMYRILDEKIRSKTVHVKIRYSDFATVSIQESSAYINDTQDLYNRAKKLFYQKFDNKNGIRLLGIAVMNTEDETHDFQQELFVSEKNIKMRKVEEAVLTLSKKNKNALVQRARLIKSPKKK